MEARENKMGIMPVKKLLLSMSVPMIISMLIQAVYNVVDSIFVAQIEEYAFSAVSIAFTVQNLMIALATGTGVGVNALVSKCLGEKEYKRANKAASVSFFIAVCYWLFFLALGFFATRWYFEIQTDIPEIVEYGTDYLRIVTMLSLGLFIVIAAERAMMATGRTILSMITQIIGAITNIILDPILIFGLLGCPAMGVAGAALATVVGQSLAAVVGIILNLKINKEIHLSIKDCIPTKDLLERIYAVGIPSVLMGSIGSVMTFCMNQILLGIHSVGVAVFGAYFKLQSMIFMPVFGLNNGMVPIIAYNYGARNKDRIIQTSRFATFVATCVMITGFLAFEILPRQLLSVFNASEMMLQTGIPALRIIGLHFLLAGFNIIAGSTCQALGRAHYSLLISVCRQLMVLVPVAFLLSLSGRLVLVWLAFPVAEIVAFIMSLYFKRKVIHKLDF